MIIPTLHINQVTFLGQKSYENYLAVMQDKDAFYAISKAPEKIKKGDKKSKEDEPKSSLTTWDIVSGKMKMQIELSIDLSNFERF